MSRIRRVLRTMSVSEAMAALHSEGYNDLIIILAPKEEETQNDQESELDGRGKTSSS